MQEVTQETVYAPFQPWVCQAIVSLFSSGESRGSIGPSCRIFSGWSRWHKSPGGNELVACDRIVDTFRVFAQQLGGPDGHRLGSQDELIAVDGRPFYNEFVGRGEYGCNVDRLQPVDSCGEFAVTPVPGIEDRVCVHDLRVSPSQGPVEDRLPPPRWWFRRP